MGHTMKRIALLLLAICTACIEPSPTDFSDELIDCTFGSNRSRLAVGEIVNDPAGNARFCLEAVEAGTYVVVPFVAGQRDESARVTVSIYGGGIGPPPLESELQQPRRS